jgi:hypothetical protein
MAGFCCGSESAEIYHPALGAWSLTGSMSTPRMDHTATLVPDGRVLVSGGDQFGSLTGEEIFASDATTASADVRIKLQRQTRSHPAGR